MSGKKGMKKYPVEIREEVVSRIRAGESQYTLSREYGISRWAIQCWLKELVPPKTRGRKPAKTLEEYKYENKRLNMEMSYCGIFYAPQKESEATGEICSDLPTQKRISGILHVSFLSGIPKWML